MDQSIEYGQQNFNLPHDVIKLPSKGIFYTPKKETLKVGYLTANDENVLMSQNNKDGIVKTLLRQKIYEPGFNIDQLIDCDVQAILIFLRNTAFGYDYNFLLNDPKTDSNFEATVLLDEIDYIDSKNLPNENGYFSYTLPKTGKNVLVRLLSIGDQQILDKVANSYPAGMVAPIVTKKLESHIVEMDGVTDKGQISQFINQMPIADSKSLRNFITECEPKLNLERKVMAPSGELVTVNVAFGVEFFRPFF